MPPFSQHVMNQTNQTNQTQPKRRRGETFEMWIVGILLLIVIVGGVVALRRGPQLTHDLEAVIKTAKGDIRLDLYAIKMPLTVANFMNLAQRGYYDGLNFHRVEPGFVIQGGCPDGDGRGSPGYRFQDEIVPDLKHDKAGILSMANSGPGTNGSQFFVTHAPTPHLNGKHTVFGAVKGPEDQAVVSEIARGDKIERIDIIGDTAEIESQLSKQLDSWNKMLDAKYPRKR